MITRVYRGYRPRGLVEYLFGPGKANDHENPRLVTVWDSRVEQWQPNNVGDEFDFDLEALVAAMQAPIKAAGLPVTDPDPDNPRHRRYFRAHDGQQVQRPGPVLHLAIRNDDNDRILSDQQWRHIAEEMMHRSGIAIRGDAGAPRWLAVRHDDYGIHIMAVLVRQDTLRRTYPSYYKLKLRDAAAEMEARYGLIPTAPADRTAARNPSRAEDERASRSGRAEPVRETLRKVVSQAAACSINVDDLAHRIRAAGYLVAIRYDPGRAPCGYSVADPTYTNAQGVPVRFGGGKLAPDLSLPKLETRWSQAMSGRSASGVLEGAPADVWERHTREALERSRLALIDDPSRADGIAHATGEVRTALDAREGRLTGSSGDSWDRASRAPHRPVPATCVVADELRWMARGLGNTGTGAAASVELTAALAALALQIAAIMQDQGRTHQARAARRASQRQQQPTATHPPVRSGPSNPARGESGRDLQRNRLERPARQAGQSASLRYRPEPDPHSPKRDGSQERGRDR